VGINGVRDARGNFRVHGVFKGSTADAAGVRVGDLISAINGVPVSQMGDLELESAMDGFNSGTVKMKLITPSGNRDVVLRRATIVLADADIVHRASADTSILEIVIHNISNGAVAIVNEALARYPNLDGVVLDLRSANGDDERAAAKLAGLFIGREPIMRIAQTAYEEVEVVPGADAVTNAPVVVLMSDMTRGTAEAIAAAFYENARGVLVGTPTAGLARIATKIDLENGGALELMNKSVKTGSGREIDGRGVFPIVCLSNIRSAQQQNAFFLNVINDSFNAQDFNKRTDVDAADIRRGCPKITSGADEDTLSAAVAAQILTDKKIYNRLIME
jgi:carboxyl-terminal processing protease